MALGIVTLSKCYILAQCVFEFDTLPDSIRGWALGSSSLASPNWFSVFQTENRIHPTWWSRARYTSRSSSSALSNYCFICWCIFSPSPSPRTCSQPAGRLQLADLGVSELGQTADGERRTPHLQALLHWQKRWKRAGTISFCSASPKWQNVAVSSITLLLNESTCWRWKGILQEN